MGATRSKEQGEDEDEEDYKHWIDIDATIPLALSSSFCSASIE